MWMSELACGDKVRVMCEARKGSPHEGGAHQSNKTQVIMFSHGKRAQIPLGAWVFEKMSG
jgi:hypothetical protein